MCRVSSHPVIPWFSLAPSCSQTLLAGQAEALFLFFQYYFQFPCTWPWSLLLWRYPRPTCMFYCSAYFRELVLSVGLDSVSRGPFQTLWFCEKSQNDFFPCTFLPLQALVFLHLYLPCDDRYSQPKKITCLSSASCGLKLFLVFSMFFK